MATRSRFFSNMVELKDENGERPAPSPQPTGYRIVHIFQHQSVEDGYEEEPMEQTIDTIDVDSWEDITPVLDTLMLHTGSGFTVSLTVTLMS